MNQIHPERKPQVNQHGGTPESDQHHDKVLDKADRILEKSRQERKQIDPMRQTHQGTLLPWNLSKSERKRLNKISQASPDQITDIL